MSETKKTLQAGLVKALKDNSEIFLVFMRICFLFANEAFKFVVHMH